VVVACDRRGVRLGIEAPGHVSIVREEIVAQVADENRRATAPAPPEWLQLPTPPAQHAGSEVVAPPPGLASRSLAGAQERRRPRR
jgi:carbon storage regulator